MDVVDRVGALMARATIFAARAGPRGVPAPPPGEGSESRASALGGGRAGVVGRAFSAGVRARARCHGHVDRWRPLEAAKVASSALGLQTSRSRSARSRAEGGAQGRTARGRSEDAPSAVRPCGRRSVKYVDDMLSLERRQTAHRSRRTGESGVALINCHCTRV